MAQLAKIISRLLVLFLCLAGTVKASQFPFSFWAAHGGSPSPTPSATPSLPLPSYAPGSGTYTTSNGHKSITLSVAATGAHLFFTTNGSNPVHTGDVAGLNTTRIGASSTVLDAVGSITYKSLAYQSGYVDSGIATGTYTIFNDSTPTPTPTTTPTATPSATPTLQVATPTALPGSGAYASNTLITVSTTTSGAHLFFTTNGSNPTHTGDVAGSGTIRVAATSFTLHVNSTFTLKVLGYKATYLDSTVVTANYSVDNNQ